MTSVLVAGCGISGLTAAHYLVARGYHVTVVEDLDGPGGCARSSHAILPGTSTVVVPTEYSWRGFGPWYHNAMDVMREIPFGDDGGPSVYDACLTRQSVFHRLDNIPSHTGLFEWVWNTIKVGWLFAKVITSDTRSKVEYSKIHCGRLLQGELSDPSMVRNITWTFGPWIGSDVSTVSYHHAGKFFERNFWGGGRRSFNESWHFFNRPIHEAWFDPWVRHLQSLGVRFHFRSPIRRLIRDHTRLHGVHVDGLGLMRADHYVMCVNPFMMRNLLRHSQDVVVMAPELRCFEPLTALFPHIQVSFRMAFAVPIRMPKVSRTRAISYILTGSQYDITLCIQEQFWDMDFFRGSNVQSLWSGTACLATRRGVRFGLPLKKLTKAQFIDEVEAQIFGSPELNDVVREHNHGSRLADMGYMGTEVWSEWWGSRPEEALEAILLPISQVATSLRDGSHDKSESHAIKWVNYTGTRQFQPSTGTSIDNLWIGGAHTITSADLWSMEAAVESGRDVADRISGYTTTLRQTRPLVLRTFQTMDNILYACRLPHLLHILLIVILLWFVHILMI